MFAVISIVLVIVAILAIVFACLAATDMGLGTEEGSITFVACAASALLCWLFLWLNATASVGYALREYTPYTSQIYQVYDVSSRGIGLHDRKDFITPKYMINADITSIKPGDYVTYTCVKTDFEMEYILKYTKMTEEDYLLQEEMKKQKK